MQTHTYGEYASVSHFYCLESHVLRCTYVCKSSLILLYCINSSAIGEDVCDASVGRKILSYSIGKLTNKHKHFSLNYRSREFRNLELHSTLKIVADIE